MCNNKSRWGLSVMLLFNLSSLPAAAHLDTFTSDDISSVKDKASCLKIGCNLPPISEKLLNIESGSSLKNLDSSALSEIARIFSNISKDTYWPLPFSTTSSLLATFGPVFNEVTGEISFHRGVDIEGLSGDPVQAVFSGKVYQKDADKVIIEHCLGEFIQVQADSSIAKNWYTIYSNVRSDLRIGEELTKGQEVGELLPTTLPHLHLEVLVGNLDTNIHPLFLVESYYGPKYDRPELTAVHVNEETQNMALEIRVPIDQPIFDRFNLELIGENEETKRSNKISFHESSGVRNDLNIFFSSTEQEMHVNLTLTSNWLSAKGDKDWFKLTIVDIWGKETEYSFANNF